MSDLISRSALIDKMNDTNIQIMFDLPVEELLGEDVDMDGFCTLLQDAIQAYRKLVIGEVITNAPTVDAVPKSYADQIRWERDIAIEQLKEIGCQLGQKMDDVKKKLAAVPVVRGEWIAQDETFTKFMCSQCDSKNHAGHENFCPNCGADMRGGKNEM